MTQAFVIREHMEVRDATGAHVGTVDHVDGDRIRLTRTGASDGQHHEVPLAAVARVDQHVHLNQSAAALGLRGTGSGPQQGGEAPLPPVLNRAVPGAKPRGNFYLPWVVGLVGILLLFFLFKGCVDQHKADARDPIVTNATVENMAAAASGTAP